MPLVELNVRCQLMVKAKMIVSVKILNIFHALKYFTLGPGISKASLYDRVLICQK